MKQLTYRRLIDILRRQWWLIAQAVVVVGVVAGLYTAREPLKPYQATASFLSFQDSSDAGGSESTASAFSIAQVRLLESDAVAERVAGSLNGISAAAVKKSIRAASDPNSSTFFVTVMNENATIAVQVANSVVDSYVAERETNRTSELRKRSDAVANQVAAASRELMDLSASISLATSRNEDATTLEAQREVLLGQYQTLFDQQQTILTDLASQPVLTQPLSAATSAERPERDGVLSRTAFGALLGLVVGIALASWRELTDKKIRSAEDAETATGIRVLSTLPEVRVPKAERGSQQQFVIKHPNGAYAESIRSLATTLRFLAGEVDIQVLTVTSPEAGDGKSMVAANLALEYASSGISTVLVSGDLRRPSIDEQFSCGDQKGLSDLLAPLKHGDAGFDAVGDIATSTVDSLLRSTSAPSLRILPAGWRRGRPAELLASGALDDVIGQLRACAEMIIIDSPPTLVSDAVILARAGDAALVVISPNRTTKSLAAAAGAHLGYAAVNVVGITLNRAGRESDSASGYYAPLERT